MATIKCPQCESTVLSDLDACPECGYSFKASPAETEVPVTENTSAPERPNEVPKPKKENHALPTVVQSFIKESGKHKVFRIFRMIFKILNMIAMIGLTVTGIIFALLSGLFADRTVTESLLVLFRCMIPTFLCYFAYLIVIVPLLEMIGNRVVSKGVRSLPYDKEETLNHMRILLNTPETAQDKEKQYVTRQAWAILTSQYRKSKLTKCLATIGGLLLYLALIAALVIAAICFFIPFMLAGEFSDTKSIIIMIVPILILLIFMAIPFWQTSQRKKLLEKIEAELEANQEATEK